MHDLRPAIRSGLDAWRAFGADRYRRYLTIGVGAAGVSSLADAALTIPLLLVLGAPPALATLIGVLPIAGSAAQLAVPRLLERTDGNLRGVTLAITAAGETRGIWLALVTLGGAVHLVPTGLVIGLIGAIMTIAGAATTIGGANQLAWYGAILPEPERRFVAPRVMGVTLGLGAVLLLPAALLVQLLSPVTGVLVFALLFLLGGAAGLVELGALARLPRPGRVRVPRPPAHAAASPDLGRFVRVITLAAFGAGFGPYLSIYAISVLHQPPSFAIILTALGAGASLVTSTIVGGWLGHGSSSRLLRVSYLLRGGSMLLGLLAFPADPLSALVLCLVSIVVSAGAAAGTISANERLLRLVGRDERFVAQGRYVAGTAAGTTGGQLLNAGLLAVVPLGYLPFAALFLVSGVTRFFAAWRVDVSASWSSATAVWRTDDLEQGKVGR
ncbi:MAG TPA: hypothetical protein VEI48_09315 [Candidatus Sulfotelmatobacter sp.]|nr:hypothetical protein [Candidatus Sulfotelmatobacter sp.]